MISNPNRSEIFQQIQSTLIGSQNCLSVSAPNNFGKSTLLQGLSFYNLPPISKIALSPNPDPKMGKTIPELGWVYIDCNLRADDTSQAFYELVMRSLLPIVNSTACLTWPPGTSDKFTTLYEQVAASGSPVSAFQVARAFLAGLELVLNGFLATNIKLVLLFDEFDRPMATLSGAVLRHLRALKDRYPVCLSYVVATNIPLSTCGRENEEDIAEFYELFSPPYLLRLVGLSKNEADELARQSAPFDYPLTSEQLDVIHQLAGGHPDLIRAIARLICQPAANVAVSNLNETTSSDTPNAETQELDFAVRSDPAIRQICRRLWQSLPSSEQTALLHWLEGVYTYDPQSLLGSLSERGLIVAQPVEITSGIGAATDNSDTIETGEVANNIKAQGPGCIFAKAFEWFVQEQLEQTAGLAISSSVQENISPNSSDLTSRADFSSLTKLSYDLPHAVIYFESGGQLPLTGNAATLFSYLFLRQSVPYCTKEELISAVWGQTAAYSSENLDRLVSDLRQLIGDHSKQIIRTIHRRGLQMTGVTQWRT